MSVLIAGVAALLLLVAPMEKARAQDMPGVTEVIVRAGEGYYYHSPIGFAASVRVRVKFSNPVVVTGTPQVALQIGSQTRWADYEPQGFSTGRRSGRDWHYGGYPDNYDSLVFMYYVQTADLDLDGISLATTSVTLNGGTIKSASGGQDADVNFRAIDIADGRGASIRINGSLRQDKVPDLGSITHWSFPKSGDTYKRGEKIQVQVQVFSLWKAPVTVTGTPQVALQIGTQKRRAVYDPVLSTPRSLIFSYVVQAGDSDNDGFGIGANPSSNALTLNGGSIAIRGGTTPASTTHLIEQLSPQLYVPRAHKVDGSQTGEGRGPTPIRTRFTSVPANGGAYHRGEEILVTYTFDQDVKVTDTPQLTLSIGTYNRQAAYDTARSKGTQIVFSYSVQAGDHDTDGWIGTIGDYPLSLNGGRIASADGMWDANISRYDLNPWQEHHVDGGESGGGTDPGGGTNPGGGNPGPSLRVSAVRWTGTPASGATYRLGEQIQAAVTFSDAVTVTGAPQLGLSVGTQTRQAVYDATESKGTLVVFSYSVQATDADADGISIAANALALNSGTITLASDSATAAALDHGGVGTDDTRKVDGSTDVVEHGDSREQATLLVLSARTTGEVGETGQENDLQVGVATARSAEVAGALEQTGDADYFRVEVPGAGRLTVETTGATDTVGALLGATGQALTEDDDGGTGSNFRIERPVQAGTYYVAVTGGESEQVVGLYTLAVRFTPASGGTTVGNVAPPPGRSTPPRGSRPPAGSTPPDRRATGDREDRQPVAIRLNTKTTGRLDRAGEVDRFRVEVQEAGTVTVEASGAAAPVAYFGAGDEPSLPARAGVRAVQTAWPVTAGTYHVAVVGGTGRTRTGAYTVAVHFTAAWEEGPLRATLLNVAPAHAWVHFYCGRTQDSEAAACTAQVQCRQHDGPSVAWDVEVAPETIFSYWPGRTTADGTAADFAAALVGAGRTDEAAGQRTTCRVFSPDPLEVRAYTQVAGELVAVASPPAPLDATAPTRVATLLNVAPAQAYVHLACRKTQTAEGEPVDPCQARLQCGQQDGTPVAWDVDVAAETTVTYGPGGTAADLTTALVAAGKTDTEARRRTTCQVFSRDPLDAWAYTRVGGDLVSVANPPAPVDAAAPTRVTTLLNVAPAHAWVHFYCRKAHDPAAEPVDPCHVRLQCGQRDGAPVAWDVNVAPETIVTYGRSKRAADGTPADFSAALIGAGRTEADARRRTTCQVFSTDPVDVRGYTQVGGAVVPVANPPVMPAADAPTRIGTLLNLSPAHAWVHFYCRKAHRPDAETADPCNVQLQCGQQDGPSVAWDVDVAPETIFSYWPGRTAADGTSANLAAALVAAGKTEAEAQRRTTCQVFSADPVDVRGYTQLDETVVPVKN